MHMTRHGEEDHWTILPICHSRCPYSVIINVGGATWKQQKLFLGKCQELQDETSQQQHHVPFMVHLLKDSCCLQEADTTRRCVEMTGLLIYYHASPTKTHLHTHKGMQAHHSYCLSCIVSQFSSLYSTKQCEQRKITK